MAMLRHLDAAQADGITLADSDAAVGFVLWHDAVYDPRSGGGRNEELSAALCRAEMSPIADSRSVDRAARAIEATVTHRLPDADCPDGAILLDIDLSILGAEAADFDAYDAAIRREYAYVPEPEYRAARAGILARFLERDRLYLTAWGHDRWEARARINLDRAIARLR